MTGGMNYKESLEARLNIINPSLSQVSSVIIYIYIYIIISMLTGPIYKI